MGQCWEKKKKKEKKIEEEEKEINKINKKCKQETDKKQSIEKIKEMKKKDKEKITKKEDNKIYNINNEITENEEEKKQDDDISMYKILKLNNPNPIKLGMNIGSFKTIYSISSKKNESQIFKQSQNKILSIMSYTKDHRAYGENSINTLKQNLETSYNNLPRIISLENNDFLEEELKYNFHNNKENNKLYCNGPNQQKEEIRSECIIADFLYLIKKDFIKQKMFFDSYSISIPDFISFNQKQTLKLICESIEMEQVKIFNESSAITMYYGYNIYNNFFMDEKKNILNKSLNVLFIDGGHSKISFILSNFNNYSFKVIKVKNLPNIGGRNFDILIYDYCIEKYQNTFNQKIIINEKIKYTLLNNISKQKIFLTTDKSISISIDFFPNNEELIIELKREDFERIIEKYIIEIEQNLDEMIKYSKDNNINIDRIEIIGELMNALTFKKIFERKNLKTLKTFPSNEYTTIGSTLLADYEKNNFPISSFHKFYHYNSQEECINSIEDNNLKEMIQKHIQKFDIFDKDYHDKVYLKNKALKSYFTLKKIIKNAQNLKGLDKKINTAKNLQEMKKLNDEVDNFAFSLIDNLIKTLKEKNDKKEIINELEEIKKEKLFYKLENIYNKIMI